MTKIYDCFTFFNEIEILKFRIKYLKDVVDYFVIVEGNKTFSGSPKEQRFSYDFFTEEERQKIKYAFVDIPDKDLEECLDFNNPDFMSQTKDGLAGWGREHFQRNYIYNVLVESGATGNDVILISDVDEIPNPTMISILRQDSSILEEHLMSIPTFMFYYNIYNPIKVEESDDEDLIWYHPKAVLGKYCGRPNAIRSSMPSIIPNNRELLGWHFTFFGDNDKLAYKCSSRSTHSHESEDPIERIDSHFSQKESLTKKLSIEDIKERYQLPDLVFSDEFKKFFEGEENDN